MSAAARIADRVVVGVIASGSILSSMHRDLLRGERALERGRELYHFQGGITGYTLADPTRCLDPQAWVVERQAYDYFITISGAKFEELMLLTENGTEFASLGEGWPVQTVQTEAGQVMAPGVWLR